MTTEAQATVPTDYVPANPEIALEWVTEMKGLLDVGMVRAKDAPFIKSLVSFYEKNDYLTTKQWFYFHRIMHASINPKGVK